MDRVLLLALQGATSKPLTPKLSVLLGPWREEAWVYSSNPSCGQIPLDETWFLAYATKNIFQDAWGTSLYIPHLKGTFIMDLQLVYGTTVILWIPNVQPPKINTSHC